MSSKEDILSKYRKNIRQKFDMPSLDDIKAITYPDPLVQFTTMTESVGGHVIEVKKGQDINTIIKELFPDAKEIASNLPEVTIATRNPDAVGRARDLNGTDVGIIRGQFGVAENARPHDKLENVGRRYYARSPAVFVEDNRERHAALGEGHEKVVERNGLRHEKRLEAAARPRVDHTLYRVGRALEHRQIVMLRVLEAVAQEGFVAVDIVTLYVDARRHLVIGAKLRKSQHALDHLGVGGRDRAVGRGRLHNRNQFIVRQGAALAFQRRRERL